VDPVQPLAPPFQPAVLARVPWHQPAPATPPRPPLVHLFLPRHSPATIMSCRSASRPISSLCFLARYSLASVGPNPRYTSCDSTATALARFSSLSLRFDARPRSP
jgi:hypothetical protein